MSKRVTTQAPIRAARIYISASLRRVALLKRICAEKNADERKTRGGGGVVLHAYNHLFKV